MLKEKEVLKRFLALFIFVFIFLSLWLIVPLLAFRFGFISDLSNFGLFRIFKRATGGFSLNLDYSFNILNQYNSLLFTFVLLLGLAFSFLEKKSFFFWSFLLPPLIYFSLKEIPEMHFFNYLNLVIIISSLGWEYILKYFKGKFSLLYRPLFYFILMIAVLFNIGFLKRRLYFPKSELAYRGILSHKGLKSTAYLLRKRTNLCDKIYTDIEGHVARIYFGRAYTEDINEAEIVVLKKDLKENKHYRELFNKEYSSFENLMPYLECQD